MIRTAARSRAPRPAARSSRRSTSTWPRRSTTQWWSCSITRATAGRCTASRAPPCRTGWSRCVPACGGSSSCATPWACSQASTRSVRRSGSAADRRPSTGGTGRGCCTSSRASPCAGISTRRTNGGGPMPQPKLSVILPTFNRANALKRALAALRRQSVMPGEYEVVVVDNNSTDGTAGVVALFEDRRIRLIDEPRQGLSYARNAGLAAARAPIVAFTDDDVEVAPDWVETILTTLARYPHVDGLGGRVL